MTKEEFLDGLADRQYDPEGLLTFHREHVMAFESELDHDDLDDVEYYLRRAYMLLRGGAAAARIVGSAAAPKTAKQAGEA